MRAFVLFIMLFGGQLQAENTVVRHLRFIFREVPVDVLVCSQAGFENQKRPLMLFVQGSLPIPLQVTSAEGDYGIFPFLTDSVVSHYHLVTIGKPGIPLKVSVDSLQPDLTWRDPQTGKIPELYCKNNRRSWYLQRNMYVLRILMKQSWADRKRLVVAGHSEGATIAADIAASFSAVTHLSFMRGNPLGRMHTMFVQEQRRGGATVGLIQYYAQIVKDPTSCDCTTGDPNVTTYEFSIPPIEQFYRIRIPSLLVWGTRDACAAGMDFLQITAIRKGWKNIAAQPWTGLDHNFFGADSSGQTDVDEYSWDKVM